MSTVLTKASKLKPEIRLAQAVSQFEADLSSEQKVAFRNFRSQSLSSTPSPDDVMRITADIDRQMHSKAGRRCFGPRFTNFLQGVQEFVALGDIIVGGSQNLIACGVWSLVRISLFSVVKSSSYMEKLSILFMDIGRSAPRYQKMALLFPQSQNLRSCLIEYFIVAVRLCHHLLDFTQKSGFQKFTATLNDSELNKFQSELRDWANAIKDEISVIKSKESVQSRSLISKLSRSGSHERKLANNLRVLNFCSKYDNQTTWKQTRKAGNTKLFEQLAEYHKWKDCQSSSTLLFMGKLGSGKSVLLANMVDDLNIHAEKDKTPVAYLFCRHDIPESLTARTILGSLARQLLRTIPDLSALSDACEDTNTSINVDEILELLSRGFPSDRKAYFVLDGLDECDSSVRKMLIQHVQTLQQKLKILLCVSFRIEPNNGLEAVTGQLITNHTITMPEDNPDIVSFIEADLERCLDDRKLVLGDPTLILEIQDALLKKSNGMFLWVALQIQSLCAMNTDEAIRDALANLPKDLPETFSRILRKSGKSSQSAQSYQSQILQLILAAARPLTVDELREALSVVPGDATWTPSRMVNDVYAVLSYCGCLLTVDEEESTVRFVHHSFKQYLLGGFSSSKVTILSAEEAQTKMADIVVTYLNYGVFGTEISKTKVPQIMVESAPSKIIRATIGSSSLGQSVAKKLLKNRNQPDFDITKAFADVKVASKIESVESFCFYSYARIYWPDHIFYSSQQNTEMFDLSMKTMERLPQINRTSAPEWKHLTWAIENGRVNIARRFLEIIVFYSELFEDSYVSSLQPLIPWAAKTGTDWILRQLLHKRLINVNFRDQDGYTSLMWAARNGDMPIFDMLFGTSKVEHNLRDREGRTAFSWAAGNGHKPLVEIILEGDFLFTTTDYYGRSALSWAAGNGHTAIVRRIIEKNGGYDGQDNSGRSALSWAAGNGHEAVVRIMLRGRWRDMEPDKDGRTPLSWAAANGHEAVVRTILERNRGNEQLDRDGRSALLWAACNGHEAVVRIILEKEWGRHQSSKGGQTARSWAAGNSLVFGFDVQDKLGRTALSWAAGNGHGAVVQTILEVGWDNDLPDNSGRTAFSWAAGNGHLSIVQLLLKKGKGRYDLEDKGGRTAEAWALMHAHIEVEQYLQRWRSEHEDGV